MQCTFCGRMINLGTGMMYVKTDGRIFYFCSSKCEKNMLKLDHNPRKTRWTTEHHRLKTVEKGESAKREKQVKEAMPKREKPAKKEAHKEE